MQMKKIRQAVFAVFLACLCFFLFACTGGEREDEPGEQGAVERLTDKAAEQATQTIRTPLDKARGTKDLGDERLREMDEALDRR